MVVAINPYSKNNVKKSDDNKNDDPTIREIFHLAKENIEKKNRFNKL